MLGDIVEAFVRVLAIMIAVAGGIGLAHWWGWDGSRTIADIYVDADHTDRNVTELLRLTKAARR